MNTFRIHAYRFFMAYFLILLTSCGGGGGGESSTPPPSNASVPVVVPTQTGSVMVDTSPIGLKFIYGDDQTAANTPEAVATLTKNITLEDIDLNKLPENFLLAYFADNDSSRNHLSLTFERLDNKRLRAHFRPMPSLAPGEYSGALQLITCFTDASLDKCDKHLTGSPSAKMPYKITVFPRLFLGDLYVSTVYANQGNRTPIVGATTISGAVSKDDLIAQITYSANATNWLSLTRTDTGYAYSVNAQNVALGSHTATVQVTSQASNQSVNKTIELIVRVNSFSGVQTARRIDITDQTVTEDLKSEILITTDNSDVSIPWKATTNVPWIKLNKTTGRSGETITYSISPSHVATMLTETPLALAGSLGAITITNESTFTIAPLSVAVEVHRLTSELNSILSAPAPINTPGYPIYFGGKNLFDGTVFEASGPSPLTIERDYLGRGIVQTVPTVAGVYTISTKNALGIATQAATVTFLANSQHTYSFIASPSYKRSVAYDQTLDSLYVVDKTNSQLLRFKHSNGAWTSKQLSIPNISDVGLSQDRKRVYVSRTTGSLNRIGVSNFVIEDTFNYSKPFPEYKPLSQSLPVLGLEQDLVTLLTADVSTSFRDLSGMVTFSSIARRFETVTGYGYKPDKGGWFARSQWPDLAFFTQLSRDSEFGTYVGLLYGSSIQPSAFNLSYGSLNPFETLDVGLTADLYAYGLSDRKRFSSRIGFDVELPVLPKGSRVVGSAVSHDWQYIYLLTYPVAALNEDAPTTLKPRVYVYQLNRQNEYFYSATLLLNYFEFDNFPTCRLASNANCLLDTLSSVSLDGKTLFFAGDKGIAVVPVPSEFRTSTTVMNKSAISKQFSSTAANKVFLKSRNSFQYTPH
jgi:hypothetical protein